MQSAQDANSVTERTSLPSTAGANDRWSVADDLATIFAPLPRPTQLRTLSDMPAPGAARAVKVRAKPKQRWLIILLAAAILIGLVAGLLTRESLPTVQPKAAPQPRAAPPMLAPPPAEAISPAQPTPPPPDVVPTVVPAAEPRAVPVTVRKRAAPPYADAGDARPETSSVAPCRGSAAWCLRDEVTAADRRLRDSYAAAVRAGVNRRTLRDVRDDWSRLRRLSNREPERMIAGYANLTEILQRSAGGR